MDLSINGCYKRNTLTKTMETLKLLKTLLTLAQSSIIMETAANKSKEARDLERQEWENQERL